VSGVGPKVALAALSALSTAALVAAVVDGDDALIATVPGIGRKTAQRIIIELKDRLGPAAGALRPQRRAGLALRPLTLSHRWVSVSRRSPLR